MARGVRTIALGLCASVAVLLTATAEVETATTCADLPVVERHIAGASRPSLDTFTIASLNIAGQARIADPIAAWAAERGVNVLLLQEVGEHSVDGEAFATGLAERLGYNLAYAPATRFGDTEFQGIAILSRDPLTEIRTSWLPYHHLRFKSRCRVALSATVATAAGPVRLVNVHLDTRINTKDRLAQIAPIVESLKGADVPQIIGGDFNTMDVHWLRTMWPIPYGDRQADAVRAWFAQQGFQTPFVDHRSTFKFLGLPVHLDWLYFKRLDPVAWSVDDVRFSDHRGVWTRVRLDLPNRGVTVR